jgi:hypothetical protein
MKSYKLITPSTQDKDDGDEQEEPATQHEFSGVFQAVKHLNYSISEIKENMNRTSTYAINFCS